MTRLERVALAQRLGAAEQELQAAVAGMDESPAARTRYARALAEHHATAALAAHAIGTQQPHCLTEEIAHGVVRRVAPISSRPLPLESPVEAP